MKIVSVVGARPNFIKIAPFNRAIDTFNHTTNNKIKHIIVHTGQHYDVRMSESFFQELSIPFPDYNLEIGSGTHAEQVGKTMIEFEKVLLLEKPDWVVVFGDVNATLACSVTSKKLKIKVCHIEAGIRSADQDMPEEINRLVCDSISDLLLTPDEVAYKNLIREGKRENQVHFVGNIMIDSLDFNKNEAEKLNIQTIISSNLFEGLENKNLKLNEKRKFGLITLHRPSNVDEKAILVQFLNWLKTKEQQDYFFIWTMHPRTMKQLETFDLIEQLKRLSNVIFLQPLSYLELLKINSNALFMLTDSGGLQEECCVLGTPFLVLRKNTERPLTIVKHGGIGYVVGNDFHEIETCFNIISKSGRRPIRPKFWDGKTAERCLEKILNYEY